MGYRWGILFEESENITGEHICIQELKEIKTFQPQGWELLQTLDLTPEKLAQDNTRDLPGTSQRV